MVCHLHYRPNVAISLLMCAVACTAAAASASATPSTELEIGLRNGTPTQTAVIPGTGVGVITDGTGPGCAGAGLPRNVIFSVPALEGDLVDLDVEINFVPVHTWAGDVTAVLIPPSGTPQHVLFGRVGVSTAGDCGDNSNLGGPYIFTDAATPPFGGFWQAAEAVPDTQPVQAGSYFTTNVGAPGVVDPMPPSAFAAAFAGMTPAQMQGSWTLRVTDSGQQDVGGVGSATLRIEHQRAEPPLYDNGPLSTGNLTDSGVAAPAGDAWSELQVDDANPGVANALAGVGSATTATDALRVADDFTVPDGQSWTLERIEFAAYESGYMGATAPFDRVTLQIWNGPPGSPQSQRLCGDDATNVYLGGKALNLLRVSNTAVPPPGIPPGSSRRIWSMSASVPPACAGVDYFQPGTYWLDWNSRTPALGAHFTPPLAIAGRRNRPGDNARQRNESGNWIAVIDTGIPTTSPGLPVDLPFKLYGVIGGDDFIFANGFD